MAKEKQHVESTMNAGIVMLSLRIDQMKHEMRLAMLRHTDELKALADHGIEAAVARLPERVAEMAEEILVDEFRSSLRSAMERIMQSPEVEVEIDAFTRRKLVEALSAEVDLGDLEEAG